MCIRAAFLSQICVIDISPLRRTFCPTRSTSTLCHDAILSYHRRINCSYIPIYRTFICASIIFRYSFMSLRHAIAHSIATSVSIANRYGRLIFVLTNVKRIIYLFIYFPLNCAVLRTGHSQTRCCAVIPLVLVRINLVKSLIIKNRKRATRRRRRRW